MWPEGRLRGTTAAQKDTAWSYTAAVQKHSGLFRQLLDKSEGQRSTWEYPFAAAGVNLTFMLQAGLRILTTADTTIAQQEQCAGGARLARQAHSWAPASRPCALWHRSHRLLGPARSRGRCLRRGESLLAVLLLLLLRQSVAETSALQAYCLAFEVLDHEWLEMRASYMDFPTVLSKVRRAFDEALSAQPVDLVSLRRLLSL